MRKYILPVIVGAVALVGSIIATYRASQQDFIVSAHKPILWVQTQYGWEKCADLIDNNYDGRIDEGCEAISRSFKGDVQSWLEAIPDGVEIHSWRMQ